MSNPSGDFPALHESIVFGSAFSVGNKTVPSQTKGYVSRIEGNTVYVVTDVAEVYGIYMPYEQKAKHLSKYKRTHSMYEYMQEKSKYLDIRSGYATTIHQSQGSTYDTVFLDLADVNARCRDKELKQRLIYVALTRARDKVYVYDGS